MPTGYEVGAYNDLGTIASELTRIRKLLDKLVTHLTKEDDDGQDLDVRRPE